MGDVRRLERCYRCRKVFAARGSERYCPDCRREMARERNRKRLGMGTFRSGTWSPLLLLTVLTLLGGFLPVPHGALLGGLVGLAAVWYQQSTSR